MVSEEKCKPRAEEEFWLEEETKVANNLSENKFDQIEGLCLKKKID